MAHIPGAASEPTITVPAAEEHHVLISQCRFDRRWRAVCRSCGWFMRGEESEVLDAAAVHDLKWWRP